MKDKPVMVTLFKGGTAEKTVPITQIVIPDLWHIAQAELDLDVRRAILETWHLAHALKRHIETQEPSELLEACKVAADYLALIPAFGYGIGEKVSKAQLGIAHNLLKQAIAKATGQ